MFIILFYSNACTYCEGKFPLEDPLSYDKDIMNTLTKTIILTHVHNNYYRHE